MNLIVSNYAFPEADGPLNSLLWTIPATANAIGVLSHQASNGATGGNAEALYTGAGAIANDQWAQVTLAAIGVTSPYMGVELRGSTAADTGLVFFVNSLAGAGVTVTAAYRIAAAFTPITTASATVSPNSVLYAQALGTSILVSIDGTTVINTTQASGITAGTPGLIMGGSDSNTQRISLFSMGDFATTQYLPQNSVQFFATDRAIQH